MKKYTFPELPCCSCPYHQIVGEFPCETTYCNGFKRKKPRRFRRTDPKIKAPKWCPRRMAPPICRIYGFVDENSKWMELMRQHEFERNGSHISPLPYHYQLRTEIPLGMTAKRFFEETKSDYLENILPPNAGVTTGEIIEIDDGLRPYYFYISSNASVFPLQFFRMRESAKEKSICKFQKEGGE